MNKIRKIETDEEIKIFSDPYRMRIINTYIKVGEPLTVKGVADQMGEVPAKVHYHVKKLLRIHILVLDHTKIINGITAKYYRLVTENFSVAYQNKVSQKVLFDSTTKMILSMVEEFQEDIVASATELKKGGKPVLENRTGFITKEEIYLNEADQYAFEEEIQAVYKKYRKKDVTKNVYSLLIGWSKRQNRKNK